MVAASYKINAAAHLLGLRNRDNNGRVPSEAD